MEVVFQILKISLIVLSSNRVNHQLLESKFCYIPAISLLFQTRSSSIEKIFHGGRLPSFQSFYNHFEFLKSRPATLRKQVLLYSSYFTTIPGGQRLEKSILRLTQPSLAWTGAELGNKTSSV